MHCSHAGVSARFFLEMDSSDILFQWGPCWQRLWVCHSVGVLCQGLPVRHQLGLSWVVMDRSTRGWCHWQQLPWPTQKWCHRYGSSWSLCPSWAALVEGQSRWRNKECRDLGMWLDLRILGVQWCWWVLARHVWHRPCLGLGGLHWHCRDIQRSWTAWAFTCPPWVEHQVILAGNSHEIS